MKVLCTNTQRTLFGYSKLPFQTWQSSKNGGIMLILGLVYWGMNRMKRNHRNRSGFIFQIFSVFLHCLY